MTSRALQDLHRHLTAAAAIVEKLLERAPDAPAIGTRNPAHFEKSGHLSPAGIEAIYQLFDEGRSIERAAQEMGITPRGAAMRRKAWAKRQQSA